MAKKVMKKKVSKKVVRRPAVKKKVVRKPVTVRKISKKVVKRSAKRSRPKTTQVKTVTRNASGGKRVNWILVLLISIFLGIFGVDRFLMGKIWTGILKLLITLSTVFVFGWIWWLIDVILIASKYNFSGVVWVD
ncbi:TM2 domain-containing protein [archaeon]|nr:TM2 domain-containing protein [archaeon]MBT6182833.1 TM2 domain-containing protein [archaeon]MBT6606793.1 TM2 domain-containing protein [archaeon]MBT7251734.1 TM2 domain-containing protein [archaeon]MBT7660517.1 TM2 domain-containing protein [archaeon]